jgi:hypothetical protein
MVNEGSFKKGRKGGPGRPKGVPNESTQLAREAIARFVDGNAGRLQGWLEEIHANKGAEAAFKCFSDLLEYHVPKLARHEHSGVDGGKIEIEATWGKPE